jgi:parallel beta-helix repeat protein
MKLSRLFISLLVIICGSFPAPAKIIHIPRDYPTIQDGLKAAADRDTVLVAPGLYSGQIKFETKNIFLASWFLTTGNARYISETILDGADSTVIKVSHLVGPATTIMGFTIRNGRDGINPRGKFRALYNHFYNCGDGIDYERGSGGLCAYNLIENNKGEGLDLDSDVNIVIEDNIIRNNGEDGIEIQLQDYTGPRASYAIRRNLIYGNGQNGIQLVGHPGPSNRVFYIERNVIYDNGAVGLGCTSNGNTMETYEGASLLERIYLFNNTFAGNNYGMAGGDNVIALNNLFVGNKAVAMKNVDGNSIVAYSNFWLNGDDFENCNRDKPTILHTPPFLDENYNLTPGSGCIDRGTAFFAWLDETALNLPPTSFSGRAPDIGAFETNLADPLVDLNLSSETMPGMIKLNWSADNAANIRGFEVHRSKGGIQFAKSAFVENAGGAATSSVQQYLDAGLLPGTYYYRLKQVDRDGRISLSKVLEVELPAPANYGLLPNYPNPFKGKTNIEYHLPVAGFVTIKIYTLLGQEIRKLVDGERPEGFHQRLIWDGRDAAGRQVAPGVYFYELTAGSFRTVRRLMVLP